MVDVLQQAVPPARRARPRRWQIGGLVIALFVALAAGGVGVHAWLVGEHLFTGPEATEGGPLALGHTEYDGIGPLMPAGKNPNATQHIDLRSVTPLVTENTSNATIAVMTCVTRGPGGLIGGGSALDDASQYCKSLTAFHPGPITLGLTATGLVLAVTPHRSGVVRIDGARISYHDGLRTGRERIGTEVITLTTA
ncbi:MAG: hypothetical protein QOG69_2510 [Actinomycetota bacterium]|nr:hypothetical protein [Actinomycetota bacterium]